MTAADLSGSSLCLTGPLVGELLQVKYGKRDGYGTMGFASSPAEYEGQWQKGQRHGSGVLRFDQTGAPRTRVTETSLETAHLHAYD